ncbi:hypothetical protein VNO78_30421 [Psophocarpus tetragonolobus]|uniref:Uncharacterized protein n=1 Tax=Psophocarpus tetragonolobus TaxID=3891 RepID=A0AAN9X549_PSOTE
MIFVKLRMEQINLVVGILSKAPILHVWPYEETDEYDFVQGLFGMMHALFSRDLKIPSFAQSRVSPENQRNSELRMFNLCYSLSSYLYFLVTKKSLRLQPSDSSSSYTSSVELQQPTLSLLNSLFSSVTTALERAVEEKSLLLNKIRDINELSRPEVDEIINMCVRQDSVSSSDNIQKKVYHLSISGHVRGGRGVLWFCINEFVKLNGVSEGGVVGRGGEVCLHEVDQSELGSQNDCLVLELLEIIQFRCPDSTAQLSNIVAGMKYDLQAKDILGNLGNSGKGGVYYYSERGDQLIDLASFHDKLWQKYNSVYGQASNLGSEVELNNVRETIQQLLRSGWKYNKNLLEQAAQLHMLTAWS